MGILGAGLLGAGVLGSLTSKTPKYDMSSMEEAAALIEKQYGAINDYYNEAGTALESQYGNLYGSTMQDAISNLASRGIYESPVSERSLGRTRSALGEQYAAAKSSLAGQKVAALGSVDAQKISYLQNLAGIKYQQQLAKQQSTSSLFGTAAGIGAALL